MDFTVYEIATGMIVGYGFCNEVDFELQAKAGQAVLPVRAASSADQYVYNGQITARPLMDSHPTIISKTDNVAENEVITITGVPDGADVWVDNEKYNLAAGESVLELTFDTTGKYRIRIASFPYQDWEREVTVV